MFCWFTLHLIVHEYVFKVFLSILFHEENIIVLCFIIFFFLLLRVSLKLSLSQTPVNNELDVNYNFTCKYLLSE